MGGRRGECGAARGDASGAFSRRHAERYRARKSARAWSKVCVSLCLILISVRRMCLYMAICVSALCAYLCYVYTNTSGTGISPHGEESWVVLSPDNTEIDNSVAQDMYDDEDSANSVTNASLSSRPAPAFTPPEAQLGSRGAGGDHRGRLLVDGERALTHDTGVSCGSTDNEDEEDESSSSHPTTPPENVCDTECDDAGGLGVRDGTAARMLPRNGSLPERTCPTTHRKIDGQTDNRHTHTHTHTHRYNGRHVARHAYWNIWLSRNLCLRQWQR